MTEEINNLKQAFEALRKEWGFKTGYAEDYIVTLSGLIYNKILKI